MLVFNWPLIRNAITLYWPKPTEFEINVPITGSAVQSDLDDATSGKLLLAGAGGLLGQARIVSDLTVAFESKHIRFQGETANDSPDGAAFQYVGTVIEGDPGVGLFCGRVTGTPANQKLFFGSRLTNTGALAWREIALV